MAEKATGKQETASAMSRHSHGRDMGSLAKFKSDLQISLDYYRICNCIMFTDKAKTESCTSLIEACPSEIPNEPGKFILCSKCHTQE